MKLRILIVEDDEVSAFASKTVVEQSGYCDTPVIVDNGQAALDYLNANEVDLVLLDISMPVLDGFQFMDLKKTKYPNILVPVVMLSSSDREQEQVLMKSYPEILDYSMKPLKKDFLSSVVNRLN